jgi:hypothetical protein
MIKIEKNKLVIEIEISDPEEFYHGILKDIPTCIQAITKGGMDEPDKELNGSLCFLLEFYKELLPTKEQVDAMLGKKPT